MSNKEIVEEITNFSFKCSKEEKTAMKNMAIKYAGGNLAAWIRYSAINHIPPKKDLVNANS